MELIRHIRACNNVELPADFEAVRLADQVVGWMRPAMADAAAAAGAGRDATGLRLDAGMIEPVTRRLAETGHFRWRREDFDVRAEPDGPALARMDRGALPFFGVGALGIHVNGLVDDRVWIARRARDKLLDPGKLDHLVAGGVAAGDTIEGTVAKEAAEEAGLPLALARLARPVGKVRYAMARAEGLRRDTLFCFDLELPPTWQPIAADGEVESFELWPIERALEVVRRTDDFKFNVNLVLIDLFIRRGLLVGDEAAALRAGLNGDAR